MATSRGDRAHSPALLAGPSMASMAAGLVCHLWFSWLLIPTRPGTMCVYVFSDVCVCVYSVTTVCVCVCVSVTTVCVYIQTARCVCVCVQ